MNQPLTWNEVPARYMVCCTATCPVRTRCLRHMAYNSAPASETVLNMLHPLVASAASTDGCPHFADGAPVRIARGFSKALKTVPHGNISEASRKICDALGCSHSHYYILRKGQRPLSPAMQDKLTAVLAEVGAPRPVEFDQYADGYDW
ncbi:MAG: hypothetical protein J6M53_06285 [Bacteroidaceae bacterium]|nr:hypothetical protein [Bacteroidaceae bacterium]